MLILLILITSAVSVAAFGNHNLMAGLQFNPYHVKHSGQWYRTITYGLVHADWLHLGINMYVLYSFGSLTLDSYVLYFGLKGYFYFVLLYIGALAFSVLPDFRKHKDNFGYNAVGASGAVAAVVFAAIVIYPMGKIGIIFLPFRVPAIVFGILYLVYSAYMSRRNVDNIGHSAHFWGSVYGAVLTVAFKPELIPGLFNMMR